MFSRRFPSAVAYGAIVCLLVLLLTTIRFGVAQDQGDQEKKLSGFDALIADHANRMISEGRQIFRFDTFGDEGFWGDSLKLHQAVAGAGLGGVGPGLSPRTALTLGLKIDAEALPGNLVADVRAGRVNVEDPAVTAELLKLNAVIGVTGFFSQRHAPLDRHSVRVVPFDGRYVV